LNNDDELDVIEKFQFSRVPFTYTLTGLLVTLLPLLKLTCPYTYIEAD